MSWYEKTIYEATFTDYLAKTHKLLIAAKNEIDAMIAVVDFAPRNLVRDVLITEAYLGTDYEAPHVVARVGEFQPQSPNNATETP